MSDWQVATISECCDILDSQRVPINEDERSLRIGDVPYYGANGLQGYIDDYLFDEPLILIAEDGGYFDEFATRPIAYKIRGKSWVNNHAHILRAREGFEQDFIFYTLAHRDITPFIRGGTRAKLNQAELRQVIIPRPPKPEQRKIAKILTTVDNLIEKTKALIAKYQSVKQGLMHDLLTRGVDENGRLRPPYAEAPDLYKQSELGWIPREWEVALLGNYLQSIDAGCSPDCIEQPPASGEWGVLKVSAVTSGEYVAKESKTLPEHFRPIPSIEVRAGDVLLARSNGVADLVGVTVQVHGTPNRLMLSDKVLRLNPDTKRLCPTYLALTLQANRTRVQVGQVINGSSGQRNISQTEIRKLGVVIPSLREQERIGSIISSVNSRIQRETNVVAQLRQLKTVLMQDLLTGRVRVKVDEFEAM